MPSSVNNEKSPEKMNGHSNGLESAEIPREPLAPLWINGEAVTPAGLKTLSVYSSSLGRDVGYAVSADVSSGKRAADAAWTALRSWKKTSAVSRRDLLLRVADLYLANREKLVDLQKLETSCSHEFANMNVTLAAQGVQEMASRITSISGEIPQVSSYERMALVFKVPVGPILVIAP